MRNYADPLTSLELLNYYLTLAMSSGRYAIQRNHTTNDSINIFILYIFVATRLKDM